MKKILLILALAMVILASCSTKVDLYTYDGDSTIIYSVLEVNADTNYISVTKSSLEHDYYYEPEDIEVSFAGCFEGESDIDTISLPTIEKIIDGQPKNFYYTTKKLLKNQEYEILVLRKADSVLVTSKTKTICDISIIKPTSLFGINFQSNNVNPIQWVGINHEDAPYINAGFFSLTGYFHYKELMPGATDTVDRYMQWTIGAGQASQMQNASYHFYYTYYTPSRFFVLLENDEYLKNNSPYGVQRWLEPFEFRLDVYGKELFEYFVANNSPSVIPEIPNYSNVDNGIGLVSSRTTVSKFYVIEQICRKRITYNYPYGFYYDPNL